MARKAQAEQGLLNGIPKDYRVMVKPLVADGWTLTRHGRGHPVLRCPDGCHRISVPSSSSAVGTSRAVRNSIRKALAEHDAH